MYYFCGNKCFNVLNVKQKMYLLLYSIAFIALGWKYILPSLSDLLIDNPIVIEYVSLAISPIPQLSVKDSPTLSSSVGSFMQRRLWMRCLYFGQMVSARRITSWYIVPETFCQMIIMDDDSNLFSGT